MQLARSESGMTALCADLRTLGPDRRTLGPDRRTLAPSLPRTACLPMCLARKALEQLPRIRAASQRVGLTRRIDRHHVAIEAVPIGIRIDSRVDERLREAGNDIGPPRPRITGMHVRMSGAQRRTERGGIADRQLKHGRAKHIRHDLQDLAIDSRAAGGMNGLHSTDHPSRVERH